MTLKQGLKNIEENEDFHLLYPSFFQAVKSIAPNTIDTMIQECLLDSKRQRRVTRSPLRNLFDIFLQLQTLGLLWPTPESQLFISSPVIKPTTFPDRVDWVEFIEFIQKVDIHLLTSCEREYSNSNV